MPSIASHDEHQAERYYMLLRVVRPDLPDWVAGISIGAINASPWIQSGLGREA